MELGFTILFFSSVALAVFCFSKFHIHKQKISNLFELEKLEKDFRLIDKWLTADKRYLSNGLKLSQIAKGVNLSEKQVSRAINTVTGKNINAYINSLRVKEAKTMLLDPYFNKYTIDAIGEMAGFSNKVSFYQQFKSKTNLSPADYRKIKMS